MIDRPIFFVNKETAQARLSICKSCDRLAMFVCKECHCVMIGKVRITIADCPLGKWGQVHDKEKLTQEEYTIDPDL